MPMSKGTSWLDWVPLACNGRRLTWPCGVAEGTAAVRKRVV